MHASQIKKNTTSRERIEEDIHFLDES